MRGRTALDASTPRNDRHDWWGVYLDAPDAHALARFYHRLLDWPMQIDGQGATIAPHDGVGYIGFQQSDTYEKPVWPPRAGAQQMMLHLDFEVEDLEEAVANAVELGAEVAGHQPQTNVRVLLDPAGHPFCLFTSEA
jgi:predicted enzyme related to lactoylglutathione lyase